jgi:TPR repeat protein
MRTRGCTGGQTAEQGHAGAKCHLGTCYACGMGVENHEAKATRLYGQAANQGLTAAQYRLGCCYWFGTGVEKDEAQAARLFGQAAEQGNVAAPTPWATLILWYGMVWYGAPSTPRPSVCSGH